MSKRSRKSGHHQSNGNGHNLKAELLPNSHEDDAFNYNGPITFKYRKSSQLNSQIVILEPLQKFDKDVDLRQLDYEINTKRAVLMGPMTRFVIQGSFQKFKPAVPPAGVIEGSPARWEKIAETEFDKVMIQPGWIDFLIKDVSVFHHNAKIQTKQEDSALTPFINQLMDSYQHKEILHLSAPQKYHPYRYTIPLEKNSLKITSDFWKEYSKTIFQPQELKFDWFPRVWPFTQHINKFYDGIDRALPMASLEKLIIRLTFNDDLKSIFWKAADNTADYRFHFESIKLVIEESILQLPFERSLTTSKKHLPFPGLTRITQVETFPSGTPTYKLLFRDTFLPEGLAIMCVDKKINNAEFKFSSDRKDNAYLKHNIQKIELAFNDQSFYIKEPSWGNFEWDIFDIQLLHYHLQAPLFGVKPDKKKIAIDLFAEGGEKSSYPMVWIPFTQYGGDRFSRKVPALNDGSCISKRSTLDVFLRFDTGGSTANASYVFIIYWTDNNLVYDPKTQHFFSPHGIIQS